MMNVLYILKYCSYLIKDIFNSFNCSLQRYVFFTYRSGFVLTSVVIDLVIQYIQWDIFYYSVTNIRKFAILDRVIWWVFISNKFCTWNFFRSKTFDFLLCLKDINTRIICSESYFYSKSFPVIIKLSFDICLIKFPIFFSNYIFNVH